MRLALGALAGASLLTDPLEVGVPTAVAAPMVTFYVANTGDDNADGLTPDTAWRSIKRMNFSTPDYARVLFRRGDTFYGELAPPLGCELGAYGQGPRPVLTMFKLLNQPSSWTLHSPKVWRIEIAAPETHEGYTASTDANIGYLMVDGVVKATLKFNLDELFQDWDFYCDIENGVLYVRSEMNPSDRTEDLRAAPNGNAFGGTGRVIYCEKGFNNIHDLHITGSGGCGIGGTGSGVWIHDCLIDYIGGAELLDGSQRRYGNGIEHWVNVSGWLIERNEICQVYDAAWSPQGYAGAHGGWRDLTVRNNFIHECTQSFEFWSTGEPTAPGYERVLVQGNYCENGGYSSFADARPDQDVRVHLLTYKLRTPVDITIERNVFVNAFSAYSYHSEAPPTSMVTRENVICLRRGQRLEVQSQRAIESAMEWQAETGRESGSTMKVAV
ncbi:hypothetical protein MJO55_07240 [Mycolicibacterium rufum]|uniref:Right handed beta helix region n=1 Tax=Mycolicibacterium rufum TaxID=318424 RepID=A0A9X2YHK8_9MYCO|nr:hypothetical protein [Mycolicibacterium rufum]MCV7073475.1 hypothetical protein [Mycolicibacterium rufum]ULP38214.1 hypothetical protein MJO55_07240 [Mycolicibacterium rufum]